VIYFFFTYSNSGTVIVCTTV